jgi:hypothetical protein
MRLCCGAHMSVNASAFVRMGRVGKKWKGRWAETGGFGPAGFIFFSFFFFSLFPVLDFYFILYLNFPNLVNVQI